MASRLKGGGLRRGGGGFKVEGEGGVGAAKGGGGFKVEHTTKTTIKKNTKNTYKKT